MKHITWGQYYLFREYYEKMREVAPDYRVGQAFLNYFPDLDKEMIRECWAEQLELYNERSDDVCWDKIKDMIK
jgi:hypothetical protein